MTIKTMLGLLASGLVLCACSVVPAGPTGAGDSAVAAAEKLRVAMIDPDRDVLSSLVDDELSYGHSGGKVDTKASFIGDLVACNVKLHVLQVWQRQGGAWKLVARQAVWAPA